MSHLPGKFVWFEHLSPDASKARAFYEPLFGWHIERVQLGQQSYDMIIHANEGIGGLQSAPAAAVTRWDSYLSVLDVDRAFKTATSAGAKVVQAPTDFNAVGRGACVTDPTGAAVWLWKSAETDRPDSDPTPAGEWYWNELWTPDAQTALAFYERVAGYTHQKSDLPDGKPYYLLTSNDGKQRAGLFETVGDKAPAAWVPSKPQAMWLPYVQVDDCDASTAKAQQLGAKCIMSPYDIPAVGRLALLLDPLGAPLAIIKGTPART